MQNAIVFNNNGLVLSKSIGQRIEDLFFIGLNMQYKDVSNDLCLDIPYHTRCHTDKLLTPLVGSK